MAIDSDCASSIQPLLEQDEKLLWAGRTSSAILREARRGVVKFAAIVGIPVGAFACAFVLGIVPLPVALLVGSFVGAAMMMGVVRFFNAFLVPRLEHSVYAVTDRRAIVRDYVSSSSYFGDQLVEPRAKKSKYGTCDIPIGVDSFRRDGVRDTQVMHFVGVEADEAEKAVALLQELRTAARVARAPST